MKFVPYAYQSATVDYTIDHPFCGLFLGMGLGKTVCTLTAVDRLIHDYIEVTRVLVIAPKRVAEYTWTDEAAKWEHLSRLRLSKITGTAKQRRAALEADADVYVIGRDNVVWLVSLFRPAAWPFDMVIIDELTSFKTLASKRFKALRKIRPYTQRVVGLTGTPAPNGLIDLWPQMYLIDSGERLGRTVGCYRSTYFKPGRCNGLVIYEYLLRPGAAEQIAAKLADICKSMRSEDYIQLPERVDKVIRVQLTPSEAAEYARFRRARVLELRQADTQVDTVNAAALSNKLQQYANGAIYDDKHEWHELHTAKLEALEELAERAQGEPLLVLYQYRHDMQRIKTALAKYGPEDMDGTDILKRWNAGGVRVLLAHPASMAYGLNMQQGGHIVVWFGLTWDLELYQQANARLHRQGQMRPVIVYHLITAGTVEENILPVLTDKAGTQRALMEALQAHIA